MQPRSAGVRCAASPCFRGPGFGRITTRRKVGSASVTTGVGRMRMITDTSSTRSCVISGTQTTGGKPQLPLHTCTWTTRGTIRTRTGRVGPTSSGLEMLVRISMPGVFLLLVGARPSLGPAGTTAGGLELPAGGLVGAEALLIWAPGGGGRGLLARRRGGPNAPVDRLPGLGTTRAPPRAGELVRPAPLGPPGLVVGCARCKLQGTA